jgi:2'-5' RNA ligase
MRLFIAVNLSAAALSRLIHITEEIKSVSVSGSFCTFREFHLTLAFLGECDEEQTFAAKSVLSSVAFKPFTLEVNHLGRFKRDKGDIWWAGVKKNKALSRLRGDLAYRLNSVGFKLESRKFHPHITLGRKIVSQAEPFGMGSFKERVEGLELMKSESIDECRIYTSIFTRGKGPDR